MSHDGKPYQPTSVMGWDMAIFHGSSGDRADRGYGDTIYLDEYG